MMQKALVEKLGVQVPLEGNLQAIMSMQHTNEENCKRPLTIGTTNKHGNVRDGVHHDKVGHEGDGDVQCNANVATKGGAHGQVGCSSPSLLQDLS
jgi:hypothetical protein